MRKTISLILCLAFMATMFAGCTATVEQTTKALETTKETISAPQTTNETTQSTTQKEMTKITLSEVTHSVFYAPQYVAMELGFFKDEGLEIELISGQGADKVMTAVIAEQAQIGLAGPEAPIYLYNQGRENYGVVFAQLTKRDGSFLVGRQPEPNFKWENLKGKSVIGGRKGGVPEMTLEYVMANKGVEPHVDVEIDTNVQFALMAGAFTGGQGDYVTLFEPTATMMEKEGKGYVIRSIGEDSGEVPYTAYFCGKEYMEQNPEIIEKFTRAVYRGQQWVMENDPEQIAKYMEPYFPDTDIEILTDVAKRYKDIDAWNIDPIMTKDSFERLQDIMENAKELEKRADFEKVVNNSFAEKIVEENK